jgi:hypothetical protein
MPDGYPVLTGRLVGPNADKVSSLTEAELIEMAVASLAEIFRSTCGPHQEGAYRVASDPLGQRSVHARCLFLRHAQNTRSTVGAEETER